MEATSHIGNPRQSRLLFDCEAGFYRVSVVLVLVAAAVEVTAPLCVFLYHSNCVELLPNASGKVNLNGDVKVDPTR